MRSNPPADDAPTDAEMSNVKVATGATYTPSAADLGKVVWCRVTATNSEGGTTWATKAAPAITFAADTPGIGRRQRAGHAEPHARLARELRRVHPGRDRTYTASTTANVISTAGDATLTADGGTLSNGAFSLREPLQVAFSKSAWTGPASNDAVTITFKQHVAATEPLRTGSLQQDRDLHLVHDHALGLAEELEQVREGLLELDGALVQVRLQLQAVEHRHDHGGEPVGRQLR